MRTLSTSRKTAIYSMHYISQWLWSEDIVKKLKELSGRQWTWTFSRCLLSVSIRTCSSDREAKMSSYWVYLTSHWPVPLWAKTRPESPLHMVSLHIYCLKNTNSEAHYAWPASINIAQKTRLQKLMTHSQPSPHRPDSLSLQTWLQKPITHGQPP